ncbi:MAG TPA: MFS transporter [Myxococcota bacterium]|nr:MFS transporter [Myxococcota bacterium]
MAQPAPKLDRPDSGTPVTPKPWFRRVLGKITNAPALTPRQHRVLWLVSLASLFDQYDRSLIVMALPQIQAGLSIPESQIGWLGSFVRFGSLPALFIALAADRIGRRRALLGTVLAYTLLTGASAFAPDLRSFLGLQFLSRVFGTAEMLIAVVVISEEFDAETRGWGVGAFLSIQALGVGLASMLLPLAASYDNGWRGLYLVGLGPMLLLAWLRRSLPETARFEARERALGTRLTGQRLFAPMLALVRAYPRRFLMTAATLVFMGTAYAAADFFGPKYLQQAHGWTPGEVSLMYLTAGGLAILGAPLLGRLGDRIGRRPVAVAASTGLILFALGFYNGTGFWLVPLWAAAIFTVVGNDAVLSAYGAELFPTSHRSTAAGARLIVGTLSGVLGLALESTLYGVTGSHWQAISILLLFGLGSPLVIAFAFPETAGRSLEEISPEHDALQGDTHESANALG